MKKRLLSIMLSVVLLLCLIPSGMVHAAESLDETVAAAETVAAEEGFTVSLECVEIIKKFEGFREKPYWDYSQYTVGYGTRPLTNEDLKRYQKEGISQEEAHDLLIKALEKYAVHLNDFIKKNDLTMTQGQFDALVSLSFNCGSGWMNKESNFRNAVLEGRIGNDFLFAIGQWCTAGGEVHKGLIRRRLIEANIYLNGIYENVVPENYCYVLFNANGGSSTVRVQAYDSNITASIIATATREGYIFGGWYSEPNGGTRVNLLTADVRNDTLYAHWTTDPNYVPTEPEETLPEETQPNAGESVNVQVTVTANQVNIRKGPGTDYGVVTRVNSGKKLTITQIAEGTGYTWGQFEDGWIALKYTNYAEVSKNDPPEPEQPQPQMATVTGDALRVRTGPSTGYSIVDYLYKGTRVEILDIQTVGSARWGKIAKGWISMDYVKLDSEKEDVPEQTQPTEPPETQPTVPPTTEATVPPNTEATVPPTTEATEPPTTQPTEPESESRWGTITGNDLRIRRGPGTSYGVVALLYKGDRVEILEQKVVGSVTWGKISNGWISMDYVKLDAEEEEEFVVLAGTVKVDGLLRIRSGAGTGYAITGYLDDGDKVQILDRKTVGGTVWGKISNGWISMDYVELDNGEQSSSQTQTGTVTASTLRVRSGPGTGNKIVGCVYNGAKVQILETEDVNGTAWGRITNGWICLDYVKF